MTDKLTESEIETFAIGLLERLGYHYCARGGHKTDSAAQFAGADCQ